MSLPIIDYTKSDQKFLVSNLNLKIQYLSICSPPCKPSSHIRFLCIKITLCGIIFSIYGIANVCRFETRQISTKKKKTRMKSKWDSLKSISTLMDCHSPWEKSHKKYFKISIIHHKTKVIRCICGYLVLRLISLL